LEHLAATSLLPLARISKLFVVNYMPNTPVGSMDVNISKLIKLKGNLALHRKPSHPRGLLRGAPPPQKWPHFFAKIRKYANYASTPKPQANLGGVRVTKWERRASRR
jgi:hypothetical protein